MTDYTPNNSLPDNPLDKHACLAVSGGYLNLKQGIIKNNPLLTIALGKPIVQVSPWQRTTCATAVLMWGRKKSSIKAKQLAKKHNLPLITVEDGFIRSLDNGIGSRYGVSYIVDDIGVYFDTQKPNRLEMLILQSIATWDNTKQATAKRLIHKLISHKLSKYNPPYRPSVCLDKFANNRPIVLIIDQVKNDASIQGALATADDFWAMIDHAKQQYPNHAIVIKTHPAGKGYFNKEIDGVIIINNSPNPLDLLSKVQVVFTVSSHLGFEALLMNKRVHTFGVAWYSGFGLTVDDYIQDKLPNITNRRQKILASFCASNSKPSLSPNLKPSIDILFFASYILYSCYVNPATMLACDMDTAMDYLIINQRHAQKLQGDVLIYRFSNWKIAFMRAFLTTPFNRIIVQKKPKYAHLLPAFFDTIHSKTVNPKTINPKKADHIITWGHNNAQALRQNLPNACIWCCEDGFIRSNGLGASLITPLSVVLDKTGIYYNAKQPSDLENKLVNTHLNNTQKTQARQLCKVLLDQKLSKYNVGKNLDLLDNLSKITKTKPTAKIRLVIGQVEDDASLANSLSNITTNQALLEDVRQKHPNDIIIYKPHPDIEAKLRIGSLTDECFADVIASDTPIFECIQSCDSLHTISSQAGFEALLQGKMVVCYGLPFYAGFGLTTDLANSEQANLTKARRQRQVPLDLDTLVFVVLIDYPLYHLPHGVGLATAMQAVAYLSNQNPKKPLITHRFMQYRHCVLQQYRKFF